MEQQQLVPRLSNLSLDIEEKTGGSGAEKKYWRLPELVEKLLPFLDLDSIRELAKAHKLTRQILGRALIWNQLINSRILHREEITHQLAWLSQFPQHSEILPSESTKVGTLAEILEVTEDSDKSQLLLDLLFAICEGHILSRNTNQRRLIELGLPCGQTGYISILGFMLLHRAQAGEEIMLPVVRIEAPILYDPPLTDLSSYVAKQPGKIKSLEVDDVRCFSKEDAEAIATLVEQSETVGTSIDYLFMIFIEEEEEEEEEEIGTEGWSAIRRAVEALSAVHGKKIRLRSERNVMLAGERNDMKAIWEGVAYWDVYDDNEDREMEFSKAEGVGWEGVEGQRGGLGAVLNMTNEEWLEEVRHYGKSLNEEEDVQPEGNDDQPEEQEADP